MKKSTTLLRIPINSSKPQYYVILFGGALDLTWISNFHEDTQLESITDGETFTFTFEDFEIPAPNALVLLGLADVTTRCRRNYLAQG